ncbi:MAG: serine/threonine protein kinase [Planctomycetes bacterium]|nr:serine/threonine protein kinase [Planctomycetota bacterium]
MRDERGRRVAGYEILREIGRGGMGVVYEARGAAGDAVALKVLSPGRANDADSVRRFLREGEIARRLDHPNIVRIHEVGQDGDLCYIAMDLHLGPTLEDLVFELRRDRREALYAFLPDWRADHERPEQSAGYHQAIAGALAQVAKAVEYAHQQGLVHRDIKPGNILIAGPQRLLLTDFGLVRELDAETRTLTGDLLGTPLYMSPEQIMGRRELVGPRSDVYALGATLHECLGLLAPYDAQDLTRLARQIETGEPRDLARLNPSLPRMLVTIAKRAMAKRPEDRYAGAAHFADDLERFVAGRSIVARPPDALERARNVLRRRPEVVLVTATLIVAAVVVAGVLVWRDRAEKDRRAGEARAAFVDGRAQLARGAFRAAWSAAAEADSLAPDSIWGRTLREDVEAAFRRDFDTRLLGGLEGLLRLDELLVVAAELPDSGLDLEALRAGVNAERRRALGLGASLEDPRLDQVYASFARERPGELEELRLQLAPGFNRAIGDRMARFQFGEAARLAERATRWGVVLGPGSGVPETVAEITGPGHLELQVIAADLFGDDVQARRRALVRLSDPVNFVRLPWTETSRMIDRFLVGVADEGDAREFIRLADRLALPGFGAQLVALVTRFPALERSLVELASRHPDPALTEFLFGVHDRSGRVAMEPTLVGALRAADDPDILRLARQLEVWRDHAPEGLRLLLFVLDRRGLSDLDRRLAELAQRVQDPDHLLPIFEVIARRGGEVDPGRALPLLVGSGPELQLRVIGALPAGAFVEQVVARLGSPDPEDRRLAMRLLLARPEKGEDLLLAIADDEEADDERRALALFALGALRSGPAQARLVAQLTASSIIRRRSAFAGLARRDGSDRRGPRFSTLRPLARETLLHDPSLEVRAAAVDLVASLSAHELAGELTAALETWEPDTARDLLGRFFGDGRRVGDFAPIIDLLGFAPVAVAQVARETNRELLALALCRALGRLGLDPAWDDEDGRRRAAEALLDLAGREEVSVDLARAAWEALDAYRGQVLVSELVAVARGLSRAEVAAAAGRVLIRREASVAAADLLDELPISSPSSRAVAALAYLAQGQIFAFEEELVRAWVSGFRDLAALGPTDALQAGRLSTTVREIDRRLRTETLVD